MFTVVCLPLCACGTFGEKSTSSVHLAVAWTNTPDSYSYQSTLLSAKESGADVTTLDMVKSCDLVYEGESLADKEKDEHSILSSSAAKKVKCSRWSGSNAEEVLKGVDCVIIPGGWDISPTLYYSEQPWHGIEEDGDYSAERDVSDYLLISYCIDHDIPIFCICRGMQMLGVVSGADMIQDIGAWFKDQGITYDDTHRDPLRKSFQSHDVQVLSHDSLLYQITKADVIEKVPSWHHQNTGDVSGTRLTVTAVTETCGIPMIEAVERSDCSFCIGVQYHPEVAVRKTIENEADAENFMNLDNGMSIIRAMVQYCQDQK